MGIPYGFVTVEMAEPSTRGFIPYREPSVRPFSYHVLISIQTVVGIEPGTFCLLSHPVLPFGLRVEGICLGAVYYPHVVYWWGYWGMWGLVSYCQC